MKNFSRLFAGVALMIVCGYAEGQNRRAAVMICDFTGTDMDAVYTAYLQINYATAFELPPGREIKHVVLGDPINWRAKVDDDGKVCFVKPVEAGIRGSLTIMTADHLVLVFNLVEVSAEPGRDTIAKVRILIHDDEFFISRPRERGDVKFGQVKREEDILQFIRKKSKKYKVKNNQFFIENVCDDGVFTYIYVPKAQYRPAVYYSQSRRGEWEPIRYVDRGDYYVIHKVLARKGDRFQLKLGKTETTIILTGG